MKSGIVLVVTLASCGGGSQSQRTTAPTPPVASEQSVEKSADAQPVDSPGECSGDPFAPFSLTSEDMLRRRGLGDRSFGETSSSPDAPIEVCGVRGEQQYLLRLTCADGSRPWARDVDKVRDARSGSQQGNSKCGVVMIDHYIAPCPEKTYDVYMNMYMCGPGEDMFGGKRP